MSEAYECDVCKKLFPKIPLLTKGPPSLHNMKFTSQDVVELCPECDATLQDLLKKWWKDSTKRLSQRTSGIYG